MQIIKFIKNKKIIIQVFISGTLLVYLLSITDFSQLGQTLTSISIGILVIALCLKILGVASNTILWATLLQPFLGPITRLRLFLLYLTSYFFNNFTPGSLGGDGMRILEVSKQYHKPFEITLSVVLERVIGLFTTLSFVIVFSLFCIGIVDIEIISFVWIVYFLFLFVIYLLMSGNVKRFSSPMILLSRVRNILPAADDYIKKIRVTVQLYKNSNKTIIRAILFSIIFQIITLINTVIISNSLGIIVPIQYFFMIVPLIALLSSIPISIQGLGVREAGFVFFLAQVGVPSAEALSLSLISFSLNLLLSIIGGVIYTIQSLGKCPNQIW